MNRGLKNILLAMVVMGVMPVSLFAAQKTIKYEPDNRPMTKEDREAMIKGMKPITELIIDNVRLITKKDHEKNKKTETSCAAEPLGQQNTQSKPQRMSYLGVGDSSPVELDYLKEASEKIKKYAESANLSLIKYYYFEMIKSNHIFEALEFRKYLNTKQKAVTQDGTGKTILMYLAEFESPSHLLTFFANQDIVDAEISVRDRDNKSVFEYLFDKKNKPGWDYAFTLLQQNLLRVQVPSNTPVSLSKKRQLKAQKVQEIQNKIEKHKQKEQERAEKNLQDKLAKRAQEKARQLAELARQQEQAQREAALQELQNAEKKAKEDADRKRAAQEQDERDAEKRRWKKEDLHKQAELVKQQKQAHTEGVLQRPAADKKDKPNVRSRENNRPDQVLPKDIEKATLATESNDDFISHLQETFHSDSRSSKAKRKALQVRNHNTQEFAQRQLSRAARQKHLAQVSFDATQAFFQAIENGDLQGLRNSRLKDFNIKGPMGLDPLRTAMRFLRYQVEFGRSEDQFTKYEKIFEHLLKQKVNLKDLQQAEITNLAQDAEIVFSRSRSNNLLEDFIKYAKENGAFLLYGELQEIKNKIDVTRQARVITDQAQALNQLEHTFSSLLDAQQHTQQLVANYYQQTQHLLQPHNQVVHALPLASVGQVQEVEALAGIPEAEIPSRLVWVKKVLGLAGQQAASQVSGAADVLSHT